jgi:hypothetical protein
MLEGPLFCSDALAIITIIDLNQNTRLCLHADGTRICYIFTTLSYVFTRQVTPLTI